MFWTLSFRAQLQLYKKTGMTTLKYGVKDILELTVPQTVVSIYNILGQIYRQGTRQSNNNDL